MSESLLLKNFDLLATAPGGVARLRELILTFATQGKLVPQNSNDEPAGVLLKRIELIKGQLSRNKKSTLDSALTEADFLEGAYVLPAGWEWSNLRTIGVINPRNDANDEVVASFVQMSSIPASFLAAHVDEPRPWRDIKTGFTQFAEGDVGVAKITPCFENGKSTVFKNLRNGIGAGTTELHIVRPLEGISPQYVLLFLKSPKFLIEGESKMTGSAGQKRLSRAYFENKPFPLPPLAEQIRIVTRVEELMKLCDALELNGRLADEQHARLTSTLFDALAASESAHALAENWERVAENFDLLLDRPEAVDALEQIILQLAVRGLLVPQDPQDEPASELLKKIRLERGCLVAAGKIKQDKSLVAVAQGEKPIDLPSGWEWVPIEALAHVGTGTTPSRDNTAFFEGGSIPWVTSGETGKPFIVETAQHVTEMALVQTSLSVYPVGTLIVAMYGQGKTRGQVSELCINAATNQACAAIVLVEPSPEHRSFIKLVFEKSYDEIRELSAGGAQPNLNVGKVKATMIPLPPLIEQCRIVTRVKQLRRLCTDLRLRLTAARKQQSRIATTLVEQQSTATI